jgi:DNA-binding protein HU-beta
MNKQQLTDAVALRLGSRQAAAEAVDAVLDAVIRAVAGGERVSVTGFGSFRQAHAPARYARNPQTGERVHVKATRKVRFRPGASFQDLVTGRKKLPTKGSAIKKAPKTERTKPTDGQH